MEPLKIAIVGGQNIGKTTLVRTLTKSNIGDVEDRAGSPEASPYEFETLQAIFIDTPGFKRAGEMLRYFDALKICTPDELLKLYANFECENAGDFKAIEAVKESDVVVYVASLEHVPEEDDQSEILLVKKNNTRVVAVLNQEKEILKAKSKPQVENRINQWRYLFTKEGIPMITFDSHWDNPAKIEKIYMTILEILDEGQKLRFKEGFKQFKKRQKDIRKEVCNFLAELIEDCREATNMNIPKNEFNKEAAEEKIVRIINGQFAGFIYCVSDLYKIAAENPTTSKDELLLKMQPKANWGNRISTGGGAAAILGAVGALITGILGAGLAALLTGGVGAIAGASAWAPVGGAIGSAVGSLGIFSDQGDTVSIQIEIAQLRNLLIKGVAIIWGLSNIGYGRGRKLSSDEAKQLEEQIYRIQASIGEISWANANKSTIREHCEQILDRLETEIQ